MVFSFNATSCQPSCTDPDAPERCEKKPGCICPRGQVLEDDICINAIHCGCVDDSGRKVKARYLYPDRDHDIYLLKCYDYKINMIYLALPHLINFVVNRLIFIISNTNFKATLLKRGLKR